MICACICNQTSFVYTRALVVNPQTTEIPLVQETLPEEIMNVCEQNVHGFLIQLCVCQHGAQSHCNNSFSFIYLSVPLYSNNNGANIYQRAVTNVWHHKSVTWRNLDNLPKSEVEILID